MDYNNNKNNNDNDNSESGCGNEARRKHWATRYKEWIGIRVSKEIGKVKL